MDLVDTLKPYLSDKEIESLFNAFTLKDTHAVIINTIKLSEKEFLKNHKGLKKHPFVKNAFIFDKDICPLGKEIAYDQGLYSIQDPSAMMPVHFLNPQPNQIVLDMCASPGGKSIQCALSMQNSGILVSNDISYPRAKDLSKNIERMGLGNVIVTSTDFSIAYKHFLNTFDKILVDAPCSGSAMFRKNEESKADWSYKKVLACAEVQKSLLEAAYQMLKPGGTLCYSTCSFSFEEDEQQILTLKESHPEIELINIQKNSSFTRSSQVPEGVHILPTHFEGEGQYFCLIKKPGVLSPTPASEISNKKYSQFINAYGLENRSNELISGSLYSLTHHFDYSHLNILRYGVKLFDVDDIIVPDHNLSHFLKSENSIPLSEENLKKYIHGDTFMTEEEDGFRTVSYKGVNLGFVKITKKVAKNHYPKGLRKSI